MFGGRYATIGHYINYIETVIKPSNKYWQVKLVDTLIFIVAEKYEQWKIVLLRDRKSGIVRLSTSKRWKSKIIR